MAPSRPSLLAGAELALAGLTLAAVLSLGRLFRDGSFLPPVLAFAVLAHGLAALCRRRRLALPVTLTVAAGGLGLAVTWLLLPETTTLGVPGAGTLTQAGSELSGAFSTFREVVAPAPVAPGFVLAGAVAVWVVAFIADSSAFRTGASVEAAVPATALFVFAAALGGPRYREATTALFLAAALAYWLVQRVRRRAARPTWLASGARAGWGGLLATGAGLGVAAVLAAVVVGPLLPGTEADAVIPWRSGDRDGPGSRVTVSPLVDIRSQLVERSEAEVFTVSSEARSYWRLTSLELFDGRIWSSKGRYRSTEGALEEGVPSDAAGATPVVQDFQIGALASIWLPAAYRPVAVAGTDARYDPDSGSLLAPEDSASGLTYRVRSARPDLSAGGLEGAGDSVPEDVADTYGELPEGFSTSLRQEARRVTQEARTDYESARALQDYFRNGFAYDLEVDPGHAGRDLERFVFETRRGYCEQFAGAYAAMARAVGLPARVAVGFTTGELADDGLFHVRGLNAHAWPEVFLAGFGWVAFEPTPGRGIPGAEPYTDVAEQQASPQDPTTATTAPPAPSQAQPTPTPAAPGPEPGDDGAAGADEGAGSAGSEEGGASPVRALALILAVVVGAPVVWTGALALLYRARRRRRWRAAVTPAERVLVAWQEVGESLATAGAPARPWETPTEYADRVGATAGADPRMVAGLARASTAAGWSGAGLDPPAAELALRAADQVRAGITANLGRRARIRRALDPRPLLPARATHMDIRLEPG